MPKIFLTGDLHGPIDIDKLHHNRFTRGQNLTKDDYLIVLGDFGLVFAQPLSENYKEEEMLLDWLDKQPWTTLFIDGNHENFTRLWDEKEFPIIQNFHNGKASQIRKSIFYLHRGQIFNFNGKTFFTMGGALSIDKAHRTPNVSWWPEEDIRYLDLEEACENLQRHNMAVDYVLSHAAPMTFLQDLIDKKCLSEPLIDDSNSKVLEKIYKQIKFNRWYFGHYHIEAIQKNYTALYDAIIELKEEKL